MTKKPWLNSYGDMPHDIDPEACPDLVTMFERAMLRFADKSAFTCLGQTLTYRDVDMQSRAFAAFLQSHLKIGKGDRVAVMMPNLLAFPIAMIGIARAGAVQVSVNPLYTPRELEHQLNDAGATVIVAFGGVASTVAQVASHTTLRHIITVGSVDPALTEPAGATLEHAVPFDHVIEAGSRLILEPVMLNGDDLIFLQYTGGTTGVSKGAALSHRNLVANVVQFKAVNAGNLRESEEVVVSAIPLYHIFALMVNFITYFSVGGHNWLVTNPRDLDSLVDVFKASRCTIFTGVNTLFAGLASHPRIGEVDFSWLRMAGGGGSSIIEATSAKWKAVTGVFIREGYGLSETSPIVSFNPSYVTEFNGTTGVPLPSTDIRILKDDGSEAGIGETGEVCVKGPQVMRGYWQKPEANAAAFAEDGYFRTGDIGLLDKRGFLKIVDRKKDMIIVSGFNVFPNELESVISACEGVRECACVGVEDERTGEAVSAYVVRTSGSTLDAETLIAYCRSQLTAYKVPRHVVFVDVLPKSTVGKVLRRELRS
ncbi:AMP-binding protein [Paraburkholderia gardini]|uniref:AMP-binding protein n=1 Tax=Paraburkholderia gardini TaxID=2823469 RepID=UPI001DB8D248|nr:AMP-binding protein [Paraburkholderia gardini]CAG4925090.1 Long-chain-fatty-acid--CoA ligase [Paraburkholderia gardini]